MDKVFVSFLAGAGAYMLGFKVRAVPLAPPQLCQGLGACYNKIAEAIKKRGYSAHCLRS